MEKFDLKEMLADVERDARMQRSEKRSVSQAEIAALVSSRKKGRRHVRRDPAK